MVMPIARSGYARLPVSWTGRDAEMVRCSVASALPVMSRLSWGADRHDHDLSSLAAGSTLRCTARAPTESISLAGTSAGRRGASGPAAAAYAHRQACKLPY